MINLTIGIPVYEMNGMGVDYLSFLLDRLNVQTEFPFEILISDNSTDKKIEEFVINNDSKIKIRYIRNAGPKDPCTNLNNEELGEPASRTNTEQPRRTSGRLGLLADVPIKIG